MLKKQVELGVAQNLELEATHVLNVLCLSCTVTLCTSNYIYLREATTYFYLRPNFDDT